MKIENDKIIDLDLGFEVAPNAVEKDNLLVELHYPRSNNHMKVVEIDLFCVRAADSIRVSYDFVRDGWSIAQADDADAWHEVYFAEAWKLRINPPAEDEA